MVLISDMYDPFHNAVAPSTDASYFPMVNGSFTGSWRPITDAELADGPEISIWNWNLADGDPEQRLEEVSSSFRHFKTLGYPQVVGGFYDVDQVSAPGRIQKLFQLAKEHAGRVPGVCYYTANRNLEQLEQFADLADVAFRAE